MNYNTVNTKAAQLRKGWSQVGSGPRQVLLMGSCRSVPYFNFLNDANEGDKMTVIYIDPFNWNYDTQDNRVDLESVLSGKETDRELLDMIGRTEWFVHEHFENFGMFNTEMTFPKNIYQFGMNAAVDLTIPNYNNHFILFQDLVNFHHMVKEATGRELSQGGVLSQQVKDFIVRLGLADIEKFARICDLSSFPEFGVLFRETWKSVRYWWTCNHVTANFTTAIFDSVAQKLGIPVEARLRERWLKDDPYSTNFTPITPYDLECYGITWPEQAMPLKVT